MRQALLEAEQAASEDEVPVGCVIVHEGRVIGRGHNRVEGLQDPTAHAEIIALTAAATTLGSWRLPGAIVFVTVEPCLMCVGALIQARVERIWYGPGAEIGACGSPSMSCRHRMEPLASAVGGTAERRPPSRATLDGGSELES
jgi:tRNA(adenine34) deaminase